MTWATFLEQIFELAIYPIISITGIYITYLISVKIQELKQKKTDNTTRKYLDMLDDTIANAVLATTQTYVDTLKSQGKFDLDAQKIAFTKTYEAVMKVLTDDAVKYITYAVGDLEVYVTNKIESNVKIGKSY
jgi:hypothetical protein